jgi:peptidoglycan/xylan/chitin deacetylase (PgdA/CDA1 family)
VRYGAPFQADDLDELDEVFYAKAARVVAMEDVVAGAREPNVIGLRHDCDAAHSLRTAVSMAHWEAERGYRSTYFLLHTSPYWSYVGFPSAVQEIAECGHEIGIHTDALAESLVTGDDPDLILERAITRLRDLGYPVRGVAGHGNEICLRVREPHESPFANDEQFAECRRPAHGEADRIIARGKISLKLSPRPLSDFGLEYEALWSAQPWSWRCSDSGGRWFNPGFEETAARFATQTQVTDLPRRSKHPQQLHLLIHPDWWAEAFVPVKAVA